MPNVSDERPQKPWTLVVCGMPVDEPPDIEIGRYALRTFQIRGGRLKSLYRAHYWDGGTAIARCDRQAGHPDESPPAQNCTCGLYGALTMPQLLRDYAKYARFGIAVFAAEGMTVIGDRGLRTAAARIVAYWAPPIGDGVDVDDPAEVFATQCPDAQRFDTVAEMLKAYNLPAEEWENYPGPTITYPPRAVSIPVIKATSWVVLSPLMTAATPGGKAAVKEVLGVKDTNNE
jgi:hypothetical protein